MSAFGEWTTINGVPAFQYTADPAAAAWDPTLDPPTHRRWIQVGNRRITLVADNFGRSGLWDEHTGLDWLTEPFPAGTGVSRLADVLNTDENVTEVFFGPTFSRVRAQTSAATLERTVLCPEGEQPWVLIRVEVTNRTNATQRWTLREEWDVRQHRVDLEFGARAKRGDFAGAVVTLAAFDGPRTYGREGLLAVSVDLELAPGAAQTTWFRCGLDETGEVDPATIYSSSFTALARRLPRAAAARASQAAREIPWHAALLSGGVCADGVLGGHLLNQGSAYSYRHGFTGAARDPLQHALPLVYTEPDLALSVLRNTCAWANPDGDVPYALDGHKQPRRELFQPSDQNLWALWLAAEYAAATGDLAAFAEPAPFHPASKASPVPLGEHLRRQFRYFVDVVGTGAHGHVRIRNADWNDLVLDEVGGDRAAMIERGESVLNSAMAAWVLPVYAALAARLGDAETASEARKIGERLRELVAGEWNGRWFRRAYGPDAEPVGDDVLWLEAQPWAILSGAADPDQAVALLATIDKLCRRNSPLGARLQWPSPIGERGGIWASINATLVWAAATIDPELGWDEWRRMTLSAHSAAYPDIWEGTLSGPDAYMSPESGRPGQTWKLPHLGVAMQAWPVGNMHSHAQPLLAYLRLLGVQPGRAGELRVGGGGAFQSQVLTVREDGSGLLRSSGDVTVLPPSGVPIHGRGEIVWP
ncbi:hypothetical protein GCM10009765_79230 [Fodinicola feengrottensis]|uniref:Glycosyl hydrolase 94 catalytic domain-containing protein n=1 Tax=Fodinicola feengrottensis TaxID=435914 RepID=A0ABP4V6R8_9ACTN